MSRQVDILSAQGGVWLSLYEACPGLMMHFTAASVAEMVRAYRAMEDRLMAAGLRVPVRDGASDASGVRTEAPDAPPDCLRWRCRRTEGDACPGCPYVAQQKETIPTEKETV